MRRKGRRHLQKVPHQPSEPIGLEHGASTVEGTVERMGAFTRGVKRLKPTSGGRWTSRLVVGAIAVLLLVAFLTPIIKYAF